MSIISPSRWLHENYEKLEERFAGKYVAISKNQVIVVGDTAAEVNNKLKLLIPKETDIIISFIDYGDLHAYFFEESFI